jgi:hypothetical protein
MTVDKENTEGEKRGYFATVDCCIWSFGSARDEAESGIISLRMSENSLTLPDEPTLVFDEPSRVADLAYTNPRPVPTPKKGPSIPRSKSAAGLPRSWARTSVKARPRISAPTDFRRLDTPLAPAAPRRRGRGFRPLELSIYLPSGRLSPLPDFTSDDWENVINGVARPKPAVVREPGVPDDEDEPDDDGGDGFQFPRKPVLSTSTTGILRQSTVSVESYRSPVLQPEFYASALPGIPSSPDLARGEYIITLPQKTTLVHQRPATSHSFHRHRSGSPEQESGRSRSVADFVRPHTRSNSLRRSRPAAESVDDAIRELNTIVEERRVTALKKSRENLRSMGSINGLFYRNSAGGGGDASPGSPTAMHIPAIAPQMAGRARSQTLSDIGSAFSMPLTATTGGSTTPKPQLTPGEDAPPSSPAATLRPRAASRLRRWFSRANPGDESPVVPPPSPPPHPFYQCASAATDDGASTSASTLSSRLSSSTAQSRSPASESYPATTATAATTPHSFSPTRELSMESRSAGVAAKAAAAAAQQQQQAQPRPSTSSSSYSRRNRPSALIHPLAQHPQQQQMQYAYRPKQRGLSIDTAISAASSVDTSILGPAVAAASPPDVPPLHSGPVGVAY